MDPAFRARVAEALQVSGMAAGNGDGDDDEEDEEDDEVWDDDQMMKVDEQLASVFKSQSQTGGKQNDKSELHLDVPMTSD